jgi:hypothetical protein
VVVATARFVIVGELEVLSVSATLGKAAQFLGLVKEMIRKVVATIKPTLIHCRYALFTASLLRLEFLHKSIVAV